MKGAIASTHLVRSRSGEILAGRAISLSIEHEVTCRFEADEAPRVAAYRGGMTYNSMPPAPQRKALGFSVLALIGLAAVALPRVILHDLHIIDEGSAVTWVLAIGPVALWITLAVVKKVPNAFLTVLVIGVIFGVMLVVTHQVLWNFAYEGNPPSLGNSAAATVIPRIAAVFSGLFTGAIIGAIGGLIAWGIQALSKRRA